MKWDERLLEAVARLTIRARRNVASIVTGNYRSAFRGSGMQFKEFRHYEPGDDIRHMSWTVTARTGKATVKTYEEERELNVVLLVDTSGSSLFKNKAEMFAELTSVIGLAAIESGDRLGFLFFSDEPGVYLPPKRSRDQLSVAVSSLLAEPKMGRKSDLRPALKFLSEVLKQRSIVIVISDFWLPEFEQELIPLSRRHEIILLHCFDDAERGDLPSGVHESWSPEGNVSFLLDTSSDRLSKKLAERHTSLVNDLESVGRRNQADYLSLSHQDDYLKRLILFFRHRGPSRV